MKIYDKIKEIANKKGISIYRIERDLNFSNGSISKWNTAVPQSTRLLKVADYLGVSYRSLIGEEMEEK